MHVREFALRFASIMDIAKGSLEELEELETERNIGGNRWDEEDDDDKEELVGWVSENCVKSLVLGFLGLLADSHGADEMGRAIKESIKDIRASGANLNRIWAALASLRGIVQTGAGKTTLTFPDPLPPPSSATYRSTRSGMQGRGADSTVHVATTAQFVPIIAALLEAAMSTQAIREEIERGAAHEKELTKDIREAIAQENAKWKDARASASANNENKAKGRGRDITKTDRGQHKQMLQDLEYAHRIAQYECIPRYRELGRDHEGRVYYVLTPGPVEREAASQLLAGGDGKVKFTKKRGAVTVDERKGMEKWSWFVGVWGRRPEGALMTEDDEESDEEQEEKEEWWGFWDPEEIKKVAEWIAMKNNLGVVHFGADPDFDNAGAPSPLSDIPSDEDDDDEDDDGDIQMRVDSEGRQVPNRQELQDLVKGLNEYADLLQWRVQRMQGDGSIEKGKCKDAHVPAKSFYGL